MPSKESLDQLVAAARGGSPTALDRLIEALSECLWREFADRRRQQQLSPSRSPADIIQDTLLRVRLNFGEFQSETFGALRRWARGIYFKRGQEVVRNNRSRTSIARRESIWRAIRQRVECKSHDSCPGEAMAWREEAAQAYALYERLRIDERTIIELRLFEGSSYSKISIITRLKPDAARKAYDRAIDRLAELFQADGKPRS